MVYQGERPAYGSLLKKGTVRETKPREKRESNPKHLAFIRELPCVAGGKKRSQAAHVRMASSKHDKPVTGTGVRPDDKWCLPLSPDAHERQHAVGEPIFWAELGIDPLDLCVKLYAVSGDVAAGTKIVKQAQRAGKAALKARAAGK